LPACSEIIASPQVSAETSRMAVLIATSPRSNSSPGVGPPAKLELSTPKVANSDANKSASLIR
jgi:hypothetical protein